MARPKKENAEYFSHDKNMRNDPKIKALRKKFTNGYSVWSMLLEVLTDAENFQYEITPLNLELLSGDFDTNSENLKEIIDYCLKIELLKIKENLIFSTGLKKRLQPVLDMRIRAKEQFLQNKQGNQSVSTVETTQSKVKESKVKESSYLNINGDFFYIGLELYKMPISKYIETEMQIFLDSWKIKNPGIEIKSALEKMDKEKVGHQYTNEAHIRNTFNLIAKELTKHSYSKNKLAEQTQKVNFSLKHK